MKLDEYLYCEECGCELRLDEDVAFSGTRLERLPVPYEAPAYLCWDCLCVATMNKLKGRVVNIKPILRAEMFAE